MGSYLRVWAVSDLHTDYKENLKWCHELSSTEYRDDVLIVAGDISDSLDVMRATFSALTARWGRVFFTPGNHDLWVRRGERELYDSIGKLQAVSALCAEMGVLTAPVCVRGVWIVPLLSWYHADWDREPDVPGAIPVQKMMVDFHACRWPRPELNAEDASLAEFFDAMNDAPLAAALQQCSRQQQGSKAEKAAGGGCSRPAAGSDAASSAAESTPNGCCGGGGVESAAATSAGGRSGRPPFITFSHFLPYQELLPEKRFLRHPNLAKAVGSDPLAERIEVLSPDVHIFGHTHFSWDVTLQRSGSPATRFVQWPLAYPAERRERNGAGAGWTPLLVWDGGPTPLTRPYWSRHYAAAPRDPQNTQPAPWCCTR